MIGDLPDEVMAPWFRLGYVIPHLHTDMDGYQFARVAPDGVMLVTTHLDLQDYSPPSVEHELPTLGSRLDMLAHQRVDYLGVSGVPLAAALGRARTLELLSDAAKRTGLPTGTDLESHIAALAHLGARRVALATRWPAAVNEALVRYLASAGVHVTALRSRGRDLERNKQADPAADHELALTLGREAVEAAPGAQALLLPGGLWFAVHAAPLLESELGIPVLLNITSTLWAALASSGDALRCRPDPAWGALLASL